MNKSLKTEVESGFRNEGRERRRPYDELQSEEGMSSMKQDFSCGVSGSPSADVVPRKIDIKGWVEDWS